MPGEDNRSEGSEFSTPCVSSAAKWRHVNLVSSNSVYPVGGFLQLTAGQHTHTHTHTLIFVNHRVLQGDNSQRKWRKAIMFCRLKERERRGWGQKLTSTFPIIFLFFKRLFQWNTTYSSDVCFKFCVLRVLSGINGSRQTEFLITQQILPAATATCSHSQFTFYIFLIWFNVNVFN
jgi:hypothetical protein